MEHGTQHLLARARLQLTKDFESTDESPPPTHDTGRPQGEGCDVCSSVSPWKFFELSIVWCVIAFGSIRIYPLRTVGG